MAPVRRAGAFVFQMTKNGQNAGRTVLVVDDDPRCRAMIAASLTAEGFNVLEASDGYQAIGVLCRPSPDLHLLIVDTEMPGLHGWEVIRYARSRAPRLRTLRLGRCDDAPPGAEYHALRSVPCLSKPFTSDRLLASVRRRARRVLPHAGRRGAPA
jgi:two-component system, OmpR family, KDP operon response regulator KdpE